VDKWAFTPQSKTNIHKTTKLGCWWQDKDGIKKTDDFRGLTKKEKRRGEKNWGCRKEGKCFHR